MAGEVDAEHVPDFTFVPVGVGPDAGDGRQVQVAFGQRDLDHHVAVPLDRQQVVEHAEVGVGQAQALGAQTLVDPVQVIEHHVGLGQLAQEGQHVDEPLARHPEYRHAGAGALRGEGLGAEAGVQFNDDVLVVSLVGRDVQSAVCSHGLGRFQSTT
ncbi:hypothetical protein FQZ97_821180 [compost metagenome]